jgi:hypothetical protein
MTTLAYCSIVKLLYGCKGGACREGKKKRKGDIKGMVEGKRRKRIVIVRN